MAKPKTMDLSPEQARLVTALLKYRFPWLGTQHKIFPPDAVSDLVEFHETLAELAEKPATPEEAFIREAAGLTKDGECHNCGKADFDENPECSAHEPFDMESDDAVEALHILINRARALLANQRKSRTMFRCSMD